jgi:hypothetical protein
MQGNDELTLMYNLLNLDRDKMRKAVLIGLVRNVGRTSEPCLLELPSGIIDTGASASDLSLCHSKCIFKIFKNQLRMGSI